MRKFAYFASKDYDEGWPDLKELAPYFLAPPGKQWFYRGGNDTAGFWGHGAEGTEHLPETDDRRIDIELLLWGNPTLGNLLIYTKWGGGYNDCFSSAGDLNRIREIVRGLHGTQLPAGLFIPFEEGWKAVKEFIETDGKLPTSIKWIAGRDLPPNTYPPP